MFDQRPFSDLTPAQRHAVAADGGPLLVLAGAGTGKTRTLACRVARLLTDGVSAERILLLTFTRRAADDLVRRATGMAAAVTADPGDRTDARGPAPGNGRITGGTFHAVASRLLRRHGHALGLAPSFTVLDAADSADVFDMVRADAGLDARGRRFPRKETLAAIYSRTVSSGKPLREVVASHWPWSVQDTDDIAGVFAAYTARKRDLSVLDYDDLLLYWRALLDTPAGDRVRAEFDHILVDEYQDTNTLQSDILRRLGSAHRNVTVVGDDAQAIYSFRAATVDNILRFTDHFPGAQVVRLEDNFRSTAPILATANAVAEGVGSGWDKTLRCDRTGDRPVLLTSGDETLQADRICDAVLARREDGVRLRDQAVLIRTGHHSAALELELRRRSIPFVKYGGLKFLEAAHVKDLVAVLRILDNPADELAWFRVLQWFDGIGPAGARRIIAELGAAGTSPVQRLASEPPRVPASAEGELADLAGAMTACLDLVEPLPVAEQVAQLQRAYAPVCRRRFDDAPARLRDLDQLAALAGEARDRTHFLTDLVLDPPASTGALAGPPLQDEDWLVLSTIHSAKGLEWDTVHVLGLADGMIPSDLAAGSQEELDEERRLLYVAVTRARRRLTLHQPLRCYHQRFGTADGHTYAQPSRFLDARVTATLERAAAGPQEPVPVAQETPVTVGAYLTRLWS